MVEKWVVLLLRVGVKSNRLALMFGREESEVSFEREPNNNFISDIL